MKHTAIFTAALLVAGSAMAATTINPLAKRTWGEGGLGIVFHGTTNDGPPLPGCALTIKALGAIGHSNAFGHTSNVVTLFVFDGQEILDAVAAEGDGAGIRLDIESFNDSTLQHTAGAALVDPEAVKTVLMNNGPFPALGVGFIGNDALNVMNAREQSPLGISNQIPTVGRCTQGNDCAGLQPLDFFPEVDIPLGGGAGGTLSACLGPSGQVRIIDADNNAGWADECVAGGFRAVDIELGGGSPILAAAADAVAAGDSYDTFQATCGPFFGAPTAGLTGVNNPVGVLVYQPEEMSMDDRIQQAFPGFTNLLVVQHQAVSAATSIVVD